METKNYLSARNIEDIKELIQLELLKRGITAPITTLEEVIPSNGNEHKLRLSTAEFQTTPVLFKTLKMAEFSSSVTKIDPLKEEADTKRSYVFASISIHYSYSHFDGGSNSCRAFGLVFKVYGPDMFDTHLYEVRA